MNDLIPFERGAPPALAGAFQSNALAAAQAGVQASFAIIGYKGRNWRIKFRGEDEMVLDDRNTPSPTLDVVIVGVSPAISKQWYEKAFVEGSDAAPDCFSVDGMTPDLASPKRQCQTCAVCPHNQWGSRVTEAGKKGKSCQDSRRLAVVPLGDIENESYEGPMLLRVPPMSLGNLANFATMLQRKGAQLEFVAIQLGFDYDVAYPRITFKAMRWLSNEEAVQVVGPDGKGGAAGNPKIQRMLAEAVEEVTHDPAQGEDDALSGPAPVLAQAPVSVQAPVTHVPPPPAPVQMPVAQPAPVQQLAQPARRTGGFNAAKAAAPTPAAPVTVQQTPVAAPVTVQQAPVDMAAAIDDLLNTPVAA
jgi:hypothetical protein